MRTRIGARVGAMRDATEDTVSLYGYGTYAGDQEGGPWPCANPRIDLDDGGVVWGCECWWGPEEKIRAFIGARSVVIVPVPARKVKP